MSYIGNPIVSQAFLTDQFSGTGSATAFILSVAPANSASILVSVSGVLQDPTTYGVAGTTLTFSAAPPSGTANISVRYLGIPSTGVTSTAYRTITEITATASQTTFTPASYNVGFLNVYQNGVLLGSADYTASDGTSVVLATGATVGDLLRFESFNVSSVLNAIPATPGAVSPSYLAAAGATKPFLDTANSDGTGALTVPTGTTAQRPSSPAIGMTRFNTTLSTYEVYVGTGAEWVSAASNGYSVSYLSVAGGGGGGASYAAAEGNYACGGGGGGGGFLTGATTVTSNTVYTITIGAGGAGAASRVNNGTNGVNTTGLLQTSVGGGGGGSGTTVGASGGSGGGAGYSSTGTPTAGGSGTSGQGYAGGTGLNSPNYGAGGGGGAGAAGYNGTTTSGGSGGVGAVSTITGSSVTYAGGGGGGTYNGGTVGTGGAGGGGNGGTSGGGNGSAGSTNTGGGGGGASGNPSTFNQTGGAGGSGIFIISYAGSQRGTGGTITTSAGYTIHTFTTSGTYTA